MTADDDYRCNVSTIAKMTGLHRDTIRKRLNEAGVKPCGKVSNAPVYHLPDAMQAIFAQQVVSADRMDPDKLDPKGRLDWFKSEREKIALGREVKELIPSDEVRDDLARVLKTVAGFFESLPDKMERSRCFTPIQLEALEAACDDFREALYEEITEVAD
ncbi:MAG: DUF1441 family protein [Aeromonas sp.]